MVNCYCRTLIFKCPISHGKMKYTLKAHVCYFALMVCLLHYLYSPHVYCYSFENIYQIVHGTKGHMAVYGPGCHPQNIIWTEAKLRSIYYFVGDRPVHKLPFGPKCHELFVILYSMHANLSDDMFLLLYI
jgi:hypothetical protein